MWILRESVRRVLGLEEPMAVVQGREHPLCLPEPEDSMLRRSSALTDLYAMRSAGAICLDFVAELLRREARRDAFTSCGQWDRDMDESVEFAHKVRSAGGRRRSQE
jgi:hypothetical protein